MKRKFQPNEEALLGEKKVTVLSSQKDFRTRKIQYSINCNGRQQKVDEDQLTKVKQAPTVDPELTKLQARYEELFHKAVAPAYKNKKEWIQEKIQEAEKAIADDEELKQENIKKYEALSALTFDQLVSFVEADEKIEIDLEDYDEDDEELLLEAICDATGVTAPEAE